MALASGIAVSGRIAGEFAGIDAWINVPANFARRVAWRRGACKPLDLLLRQLPPCTTYLKRWQSECGALGPRISGVHTPKFSFDYDCRDVEAHVLQTGMTHKVGQDAGLSRIGSPEMYFVPIHPTLRDARQSPRVGETEYSFAAAPRLNEYQLNGA
jgi:hypothetical protein